jgi:hypothetical protein
MVEQGALKAFVDVLSLSDIELVFASLEAILHILDCGVEINEVEGADPVNENYLADEFEELGGVSRLEELLMHSNKQIHELANLIITKHYPTDYITT